MQNRTHDVIVVGAGPAGGTTALALARQGVRVAVIEKKAFPRRKVCGEYLSATNLELFRQLGILDEFLSLAGPPVSRVGLFSKQQICAAPLPRPQPFTTWGRAFSRQHLDTLILQRAHDSGAVVFQPAEVTAFNTIPGGYQIDLEQNGTQQSVLAPVVVAAHGSWDYGPMPTQRTKESSQPHDMLGFKAHFRQSELPTELMPLLAFPGGYGGMVNCENSLTSISLCIRRDRLEHLRQASSQTSAADVIFEHLLTTNRGIRQTLGNATLVEKWLATGAIQPGIRIQSRGGLFQVGNAAGEAHPVVAEGISMAIQAGFLLARMLGSSPHPGQWQADELERIGKQYDAAWKRCFANRIHHAGWIARWAMSRALQGFTSPVVRLFPQLLTIGATFSGKANLQVWKSFAGNQV